MVTVVAVVFARLAYGIVLPFMRAGLGLGYQEAGNLATVGALFYLCLVIPAGTFSARYGARASVLLGLGLIMLGFGGLGVGSRYVWLIVMMGMLGIGTAFSYTPSISLLANRFPQRRGVVIGLLNSGVGAGLLSAGALVPYLAAAYGDMGWRLVWAAFGAAAAITLLLSFAFMRVPSEHAHSRTVSYAPLDKMAIYRNRKVVIVGLVYGSIGLSYIVQAVFMYSFALESGLSASAAGRMVALSGVLTVISSPCWGWISDRFKRHRALSAAILLTFASIAIPVIWPTHAAFAAHYIIAGCTITGIFVSILAVAAEAATPRLAPLAISYVTFFFAIGQFIGPAAAGLIIESAGGFRMLFALICLVLLFGLLLSCRLARPGGNAQ